MNFDIEKLERIAKPRSAASIELAKQREENREWLRMSQEIALCLSHFLRTENMTQKELADRMGVSAVYVGKLLKGNENLTLETICKIQKAIGKNLISIEKTYLTKPDKTTFLVRSGIYIGCQALQDKYSTVDFSIS